MNLLVITHFLNGILMIAIPIALAIYLTEKFRSGWKLWLIGASIFIISQVFHIPFNTYLLKSLLAKVQSTYQGNTGLLIIVIILGLSAGVFEETARYAMYRWWIKGARTWRSSILAGAGHGGIEAIILGILVLLTYFNLMAYRNLDLSNLNLSLDQLSIARQQIQAYWNAPWYATLLGALERLFTIPFHIAASVLVLQVFTRKPGQQKLWWLFLAILYHALMDAAAVFVSSQWGYYLAEAVLGGMAILDIFIIFSLRQVEPIIEIPMTPPEGQVPPSFTTSPIEETSENLDKTRFQ